MNNKKPTYQQLEDRISKLEMELAKTEWLHDKENINNKEPYIPFYGDVTELNIERTILDTVGKETLTNLTSELMDLLDTSMAIYEKNGDYAYGEFDSGWCRLLDASSRKLCHTNDNKIALNCGKWLCHDDCWNNSAKEAIQTKKSTDIECPGALRLFAEPIFVGDKVIGAINIGYGNPPTDDKTLQELSEKYNIEFNILKEKASAYNPRPGFIIEIAKKRLKSIAQLIGEIITRKQTEIELRESERKFRNLVENSKAVIVLFDTDYKIAILNDANNLLKGTKEQFIGKSIYDLFPEHADFHVKRFEKIISTGKAELFEDPFELPGGTKWFSSLLQPVYDQNQQPEGIQIIAIDITEKKQFEQALSEGNDRYQLLAENISDLIIQLDGSFKPVYVSPSVKQITGYSVEELIKGNSFNFVFEEDRERLKKEMELHIGQKKTHRTAEYRILTKNGKIKWIGALSKYLYTEQGDFNGMITVARDITERKKIEQKLQINNERYREAQKIGNVGNWEYKIQTNEFWGSEQAKRIYGFNLNEKLFSVDEVESCITERERVHQALVDLLEDNKPYDIEFDIVANDTKERKTIISKALLKHDEKGNPLKVVGVLHDITERKKAEQALKESEKKFRTLLNYSLVGMVITDMNGVLLEMNTTFCNILGYPADELKLNFTKITHPDDVTLSLGYLHKLKNGTINRANFQKRYIHKTGAVVWVEILINLVKKNKEAKYFITSILDITERKKAEQALQENEEKFKKISQLSTDYSYSHLFDENGKISLEWYFGAFEKITGYKADESIKPEVMAKLIHPEDLEEAEKRVERILKGETVVSELRIITKYGKVKWIRDKGMPEWDSKRKRVIRCIGTAQEITERKKAAQALKESEEKHKSLYESMNEGVCLHELICNKKGEPVDYKIIDTNPKYEEILKIQKHQVINKLASTIYPDNKPPYLKEYAQVALTRKPISFETYFDAFDMYFNISVFSPQKGQFATVFQDITQEKKAEQALKEKTNELEQQSLFIKTLLDNLKVGVVACDADGKLTYFNKTTQMFHGLPQVEIRADQWADYYDLYLPDGKTKMQTKDIPLFKALEGEQFNAIEMMIIQKEGKSYTLAASGSTIMDAAGKKQGAVVSMYDISERKKAEQELQNKHLLLRTIIDNIPDAIYAKDLNLRKTLSNLADVDNMGAKSESEIIGKSDFDFYPKEIAESFYTDDKFVIEKDTPIINREEFLFDENSRKRWLLTSKIPLRNNNGKLIGLAGIGRDITQQKHAEQALKKSEEKYRQLSATKDKFFSIIAHDLKNPVSAIFNFSGLTLKKLHTKDYDKVHKYSGTINQTARHTLDLLNNLLDWSRIQSGKIDFDPKLVILNEAVSENLKLLEANYQEKGISTSVQIDEDLTVFADESMLKTIIRNLLSNAIKFSNQEDTIKISAKKARNEVLFAVEDTGIGIEDQAIDMLFSIEESYSTQGTNQETGTGLGLILTKEFVEKHGGKIWVESEQGKGSTFFFTIHQNH